MCKCEEHRHGRTVVQFILEFSRASQESEACSASTWMLHIPRKMCIVPEGWFCWKLNVGISVFKLWLNLTLRREQNSPFKSHSLRSVTVLPCEDHCNPFQCIRKNCNAVFQSWTGSDCELASATLSHLWIWLLTKWRHLLIASIVSLPVQLALSTFWSKSTFKTWFLGWAVQEQPVYNGIHEK